MEVGSADPNAVTASVYMVFHTDTPGGKGGKRCEGGGLGLTPERWKARALGEVS